MAGQSWLNQSWPSQRPSREAQAGRPFPTPRQESQDSRPALLDLPLLPMLLSMLMPTSMSMPMENPQLATRPRSFPCAKREKNLWGRLQSCPMANRWLR
jgi:hypothetical protein